MGAVFISNSAHRQHTGRIRRIVFDLGTQPTHGQLHQVRAVPLGISPYFLKQLLLGYRVIGVGEQMTQQCKLDRRQRKAPAIDFDLLGIVEQL